jgi:hypothetical protein
MVLELSSKLMKFADILNIKKGTKITEGNSKLVCDNTNIRWAPLRR